jgi:hypothetical protein
MIISKRSSTCMKQLQLSTARSVTSSGCHALTYKPQEFPLSPMDLPTTMDNALMFDYPLLPGQFGGSVPTVLSGALDSKWKADVRYQEPLFSWVNLQSRVGFG